MHVAGPGNVVVAGWAGVLSTGDAGARWRDITAPTMDGVVVSHIVDIASFGTTRIWLEPVGDERMRFVPYTDDGGATWSVGALPVGAALGGAPLSFWTPETGRTVGGGNGVAVGGVYQTGDGGASWRRVAGATPGPFDGPVTFTSASAGWTWSGADLMYRTEDGGRRWQREQLPAVRGYELASAGQPEIFGGGVVVVVARLRRPGGAERTAFYESEDGGISWNTHLAPGASKGANASFAANGSDWFALSGDDLFASTDAGGTWQAAAVHTPTGDSIDAIDYLSPTIGWAEAAGRQIDNRSPASGAIVPFFPTYLLRTTDGGRNWSQVRFGPAPRTRPHG